MGWNEWSEGHYLAPHREYGFGYLDAVREVFSDARKNHVDLLPADVGMGPYDRAYQRQAGAKEKISSEPFRQGVRRFADRVLSDGRDKYGTEKTPLFVDGLHAETFEPAKWICRGETWVLSNFANQQPLLRTLDGLTALTGAAEYRQAAEEATKYALTRLRTPNGLLYWGGHLAWDLEQEKAVGQYEDVHEQKSQQPYYELMWRVDGQRTAELIETIWAAHILDWSLLDYNRHGSIRKPLKPQWDHDFNDKTEVPFAIKGGNLSFVCVTPSLLHAGVTLAVMGKKTEALTWSERLIRRWQQGKDVRTGLCGGQLSYRKEDRARDALGHVHPTINEAKIVASYHQTGRYHQLPLAQMEAAVTLMKAGGESARVGKEFLQWASDDLKTYAQQCYDPKSGRFVAKMTDGTPLKWQEARSGYYIAESFAPQKPDGYLFWACAMAYRLTRDPAHWRMIREIAKRLDLGDAGEPGGEGRVMNSSTTSNDWRFIYALLELHQATEDQRFLAAACRIGENVLKMQTTTGLFPRPGRQYARTGDEAPLALLHLAAAIDGKGSVMPAPMFDHQFFHCEYHGELEKDQQKRDDKRTYDNLVFYGD